jgi:hypothetical protein
MIKTIEPKDIFKTACLHSRPKVYLRALEIYGHNQQLKANVKFVKTNTSIKNICGQCDKTITEEDFDYFAAYWTPHIWRPTHKHCKEAYKSEEVWDCQTLDANCNDCKHFKRGKNKSVLTEEHAFLGVDIWTHKKEEEIYGDVWHNQFHAKRRAKIGDEVGFNGFCEKKKISVMAHPNFATGYSCFEHRKGRSEILNYRTDV